MNVGSLFSGIGGMDAGLARAGHRHVFFCEQDEWRREVLAARWPGVPIYDDVRDVGVADGRVDAHGSGALSDSQEAVERSTPPPDLLCGGFPCQDLSVAGKRAGLAGDRSGLFFEFARIIDALRPGRILVENVPGLLSSQGGRDFGVVIGTLADLGYGVAWRILDSRYFGVPQRRRRVFIVGARADGDFAAATRRAGEILAVGSRCPGHPPAGDQARTSPAVSSLSGLGNGGADDNDAQANRVIAYPISGDALRAGDAKTPSADAEGRVRLRDPGLGIGAEGAPAFTPTKAHHGAIAFHQTQEPIHGDEFTPAIGRTSIGMGVSNESGVRRLTPVECERLQGLPDGWTQLNAKTPDSRRYSALGDAVTANVAQWIGERL